MDSDVRSGGLARRSTWLPTIGRSGSCYVVSGNRDPLQTGIPFTSSRATTCRTRAIAGQLRVRGDVKLQWDLIRLLQRQIA